MGKLCQFLTELSAHHTSVFSVLDDNLRVNISGFYQTWYCIVIVEIWFGIANGQI